jgi:hypothetical protein
MVAGPPWEVRIRNTKGEVSEKVLEARSETDALRGAARHGEVVAIRGPGEAVWRDVQPPADEG